MCGTLECVTSKHEGLWSWRQLKRSRCRKTLYPPSICLKADIDLQRQNISYPPLLQGEWRLTTKNKFRPFLPGENHSDYMNKGYQLAFSPLAAPGDSMSFSFVLSLLQEFTVLGRRCHISWNSKQHLRDHSFPAYLPHINEMCMLIRFCLSFSR
jgi:hypothetical protein